MGKVHVGQRVTLKGRVKYVLDGLKSHDRICIEVYGREIWFELPKGALDGRKKADKQEDKV